MLLKTARVVQKLTGSVLGTSGAAILAGNVLLCLLILVFGPDAVLNQLPTHV